MGNRIEMTATEPSFIAWMRLTDERISMRFLLGGLIVLLGVWLGALRKTRQPVKEEAPCPEPDSELSAPIQPGCA